MWGKGEEIGVLCVAFDALYNRFIYTEKLLKQPFHLMLVEVRLVIYLLLNRWEHFLNGVQRSIRGILFFSRMTICCAPLLLQQSEAPDSDTLCSTPARKQDECELMLKAAPLKNFDSLEDQQWNWEMSGQRCFGPLFPSDLTGSCPGPCEWWSCGKAIALPAHIS